MSSQGPLRFAAFLCISASALLQSPARQAAVASSRLLSQARGHWGPQPAQSSPVFTFAFGNSGTFPSALVVDADGNSYVGGTFSTFDKPSFPVTADAVQKDPAPMFVAKIDPTGSRIVWATYLGGHKSRSMPGAYFWIDRLSSIGVDPQGNVWVGGETAATDFPTVNPLQGSPQSKGSDGFLLKLNPSGSQILYSTYLGGVDAYSGIRAITTDSLGNVYAGLHSDRWLPFETRSLSPAGKLGGAVLVKMNPGGGLVYATRIGSDIDDDIIDVAVDPFGALHAAGRAARPDFPLVNPIVSRCPAQNGACYTGFAAAIDSSGSRLLFSTFLGGADVGATATSIATDSFGATYVSGVTTAADFPTRNAYQPAYGGNSDAFLTKLGPSGWVIYSTYVGGDAAEPADVFHGLPQVLVDGGARPTVVANTQSIDFDGTTDVQHPDAPLLRTRDGGATWTRITGGLRSSVSAVAATKSGDRVWYAGTSEGVFKSTDQGDSWQRAGEGLGANRQTYELAIDPVHPDTVYAGTRSGTYRTDDRGQHWTQVDPLGYISDTVRSALTVDGNGWVYVGTQGVRRSKDGGRTWETVSAGLRRYPTGPYADVNAIAFDSSAPGVIYAVQASVAYRTSDAGSSWTPLPGLPFTESGTLALPSGRPHRIFASLIGYLVRSDDDGATWTRMGLRTIPGTRVVVRPDRPDTMYALNGAVGPSLHQAGLSVSIDGGLSWTQAGQGALPDQLTVLASDPYDGNTMFAAAPIRLLALVLGFDQDAKHVRSSGFLDQGSLVRVAQDPTGSLYALMTKNGRPLLVKVRVP
jgi:photosystem II stability/assembly factor-like uncharacterized protein